QYRFLAILSQRPLQEILYRVSFFMNGAHQFPTFETKFVHGGNSRDVAFDVLDARASRELRFPAARTRCDHVDGTVFPPFPGWRRPRLSCLSLKRAQTQLGHQD